MPLCFLTGTTRSNIVNPSKNDQMRTFMFVSGGPDSTSVGGTTDWESTTGGGTGHSIAGGGGGQGAQQAESGGGRQSNGGGNEGGGGDDVSAITGATSAEGEQDDHSVNTTDGVNELPKLRLRWR